MKEIITECPTHTTSQPGCYECVKESEYFAENWREIAKDAGIFFPDKNEEEDQPVPYQLRSK